MKCPARNYGTFFLCVIAGQARNDGTNKSAMMITFQVFTKINILI